MYAGDFKLNKSFSSPFPGRKDSNPSFVIGTKFGNLYHIDFASPQHRGGCVDFVMQMTGITSYNDALKQIDKDFGLGISDGKVGDYKAIVGKYQIPKIITKPASLIQVVVRKPTTDEIGYWNMYYQSLDDVKAEDIYFPEKIFLNRKRLPLKKTELKFAYLLGDKWKIYTPFSEEKERKWWPNNIPNNALEGESSLLSDRNAIIAKSRKDRLLLKKVYPCVASVQNESLIAFSPDNVQFINEHSKQVYIGYDIDGPGKAASHLVTSTFGYKHINVPDKYLEDQIKDFAEWGRKKGLEPIENHLKLKGIYD